MDSDNATSICNGNADSFFVKHEHELFPNLN